MRSSIRILVVLSLSVIIHASAVSAMWEESGNRAGFHAGENCRHPRSCSDGEDGIMIVWSDYRTTRAKIYAQRIDGYGNSLWSQAGVEVSALSLDQSDYKIIPDGSGGAVIVWTNDPYGASDIYAQRIDGDGTLLWGAEGIAVCAANGQQYSSALVTDGTGGAIFAWADERGGLGTADLYAQRIDASGNLLWTSGGVLISGAAGRQEDPRLAGDNNGGAIAVWEDNRGSDQDIYARHIGANGIPSWLGDGVPVCVLEGWQQYPRIAADGAGGAIAVWTDPRGTYSSLYAQRLNWLDGAARWAVNGLLLSDSLQAEYYADIIPDGSGGAFVAWEGGIGGYYARISAQRISDTGALLWGYGGLEIFETERSTEEPYIVSDGGDGVLISWADDRTGSWDVYASRINGMGESYWQYGGVLLCDAFEDQIKVRIAADGDGGALVSFQDGRSGYYEIYAQRVTPEGFWGYPSPDIYSVKDVPGDQGGVVNLSWYASRLDYEPLHEVTHYSIWRSIEEEAALLRSGNGVRDILSAAEVPPGTAPGMLRDSGIAGASWFWELVGTFDAYRLETYASTVETLYDSTSSTPEPHFFQIIAHTPDPALFWISEPDSGYSVDDLSPCQPAGLAAEQVFVPEGLSISWNSNAEPDLDRYAVYRGDHPDFMPGPGNLVFAACDTFFFDGEWRWDSGCYYKIAAVDVHDNESPCAVLGPGMVTGDEVPAMPAADFLGRNHPNPFNPVTRIPFGLHRGSRVALEIYDLSGRLVRALVDEHRAAGRYLEVWDGRDDAGREVSSGVYFCRLRAGGFMATEKMILVR